MNTFTLVYNRYKGVFITQSPIHESRIQDIKTFIENIENGKTKMFSQATIENVTKIENLLNRNIPLRGVLK